jgi:hypothetical protein
MTGWAVTRNWTPGMYIHSHLPNAPAVRVWGKRI